MTATIYNDIFLRRLLDDVEKWYDENYYTVNHTGPKPELEKHLNALNEHYDYDKIEGNDVQEKRVNYLTQIQEMANKNFI